MKSSDWQRALHEISLELSALPDAASLSRRAVEWGLDHLGFDRMSLWFIDRKDPNWMVGAWGTDEKGQLRDERGVRVPRDAIIAPPEFYQGKIPVLHFVDEPCYDERHVQVGRSDKGLAPLWDGKVMIGELSADNFLTHRSMSSDQLDALVLFARIVAHLHTLLLTREELNAISQERLTLLHEIKHRTRNNLSVITNLVTLEAMLATTEETRDKLEGLRDRIGALGALYLLLDRESEGALFDLGDYLATVARQLVHAHGADARRISLAVDCDVVNVNDSKAAPLWIAVNELLTDALKHAFANAETGQLSLTLRKGEGLATLEVRDNGKGLPHGFDLSKCSGLGLGLVDSLVTQIGGTLSFRNDGGAVFTVQFPL